MPAKGTGGKHLEPKEKKNWKEKKQWVKRSGTRTGPGTVKSAQKKAEKAVVAKAKSNRDATQKMYAAESMFKSAKAKDTAKVGSSKPMAFGKAFRSAKSAGKKEFTWKGKRYHTRTKDELEIGAKEKSKFAAAAKNKKKIS